MNISSSEWTQLGDLAGRIGYPSEKVTAVRSRLEAAPSPTPHSLVVGRPSTGIELFIGHWLGNGAADTLRATAGTPLVIGRRPDELHLPLGSPARWKTGAVERGHVVALATPVPPGAGTLAQMGALGLADVAVMVTRLGQPLPLTEREILRSIVPLAATVRVVVVGFAGEAPNEADLADVSVLAFAQMRQAGARLGQILGTVVWIPGEKPRQGFLAHPSAALHVDPAQLAAGREDAAREALQALVRDMSEYAAANAPPHAPPIDDEEAARLVHDLAGYLADLGREVHRYLGQRPRATAEDLRSFARDALHGWRAYTSLGGLWLRYVERLRPGAEAQFYEQVKLALPLLDSPAGTTFGGAPTPTRRSSGRLVRHLGRAALTLALGLGALTWGRLGLRLHASWLQGAAEVASMGAGLLIGQRLGGWLFSAAPPAEPQGPAAEPHTVVGWSQMENRLVAWFAGFIRLAPRTPAEELRLLATRLEPQEQLR